MRWWSDREEDAPVRDSLALPALDVSGRPAFLYRSIHRSHNRAEADPRLAIRRRLNSNGLVPIPAEWGGGVEYGPPDHAHTFDMYLPWSKYGKEHPEWYSLIGGRRIGGQSDGQLCLSNPDLKAEFLGKLREMIAKGDADAFAALGCHVNVATEDGSAGARGFVTDVLAAQSSPLYAYACGPMPMLRAVARLPQVADGQFSFEARMGCGFGACMGCTIATVTGPKRVCREGPVFAKGEIAWN